MSKKIWKIEDVFHMPEGDLRFYGTMGVSEIAECDDGSVTMTMPVTHAMLNGHGTVQGGAVCALCDMAAAAYMRILVGDEVTVDGSVQFYRPAKEGAVLTARATPRKLGKTLCTVFCEVMDEEGTRVADSVQTFYRI